MTTTPNAQRASHRVFTADSMADIKGVELDVWGLEKTPTWISPD